MNPIKSHTTNMKVPASKSKRNGYVDRSVAFDTPGLRFLLSIGDGDCIARF